MIDAKVRNFTRRLEKEVVRVIACLCNRHGADFQGHAFFASNAPSTRSFVSAEVVDGVQLPNIFKTVLYCAVTMSMFGNRGSERSCVPAERRLRCFPLFRVIPWSIVRATRSVC